MKFQTSKWLVGAAALTMALGAADTVFAADAKPPRVKAPRAPKPPVLDKREAAMAEAILGKALTEEQKTQLLQAQETRNAATKAAADAYSASKAQALGLTVEDLAAKEAEYRKQLKAQKAAAPAATTTTAPAKR